MSKAAARGIAGPILFITLAGLALAGCGKSDSLSGIYLPAGNAPLHYFGKMEFGSGGKVDLDFGLQVTRGTYEVDGKKVILTFSGQSIVFAFDDQGCLDGGETTGKYCKK